MNIKEELLKFIDIGNIIIYAHNNRKKQGIILKISNNTILTSIESFTIIEFIRYINGGFVDYRITILKKYDNNEIDRNSVSFINFKTKYYKYRADKNLGYNN